jgi:hypothetical protein
VSPADLEELSDRELMARREEVAEAVDPLLMRLEMIDDEIMSRRRTARRMQIIHGPPHDEHDDTGRDALPMETI